MSQLRIWITRHDTQISLRMNGWCGRSAVRRLLAGVSRLGDGWFWGMTMLVLAMTGPAGLIAALHMLLVGAVTLLAYKALKHAIRRPRPCEIDATRGRLIVPVPALDRWSFPSGHTMHACAFTTIAVTAVPPLAFILVPFTVLVMLSRVVLGLHWPSDVLAGALCGTGAALGCSACFG